jgi:hypothetical protein
MRASRPQSRGRPARAGMPRAMALSKLVPAPSSPPIIIHARNPMIRRLTCLLLLTLPACTALQKAPPHETPPEELRRDPATGNSLP